MEGTTLHRHRNMHTQAHNIQIHMQRNLKRIKCHKAGHSIGGGGKTGLCVLSVLKSIARARGVEMEGKIHGDARGGKEAENRQERVHRQGGRAGQGWGLMRGF